MNRAWRKRRAFTLVEILLVMAILAVVSAVTVPSFVRSIRGNRLRTAGRTVVAVTRYARSMALLHQREVVITFMPGNSTIVITSLDRPMAVLQATGEVETAIAEARARMTRTAAADAGTTAPAAAGESNAADSAAEAAPSAGLPATLPDVYLTRVLDGVAIESVVKSADADGGGSATGGVRVLYRTNGRCEPYEVRLRDHEQRSLRIKVDALSTPTVEREAP